jgi:hypothetical protein
MWTILALYFGINILLAGVLWFGLGLKSTSVSTIGFLLAVILLGLPILCILLIMFAIVLIAGATYNFGDFLQNFFRKIKI